MSIEGRKIKLNEVGTIFQIGRYEKHHANN